MEFLLIGDKKILKKITLNFFEGIMLKSNNFYVLINNEGCR